MPLPEGAPEPVTELTRSNGPCCNGGSHCEAGACYACTITNICGDCVSTLCAKCNDINYVNISLDTTTPLRISPAHVIHYGHSVRTDALLDGGALQGSYMSKRVAQLMKIKHDRQLCCTLLNRRRAYAQPSMTVKPPI